MKVWKGEVTTYTAKYEETKKTGDTGRKNTTDVKVESESTFFEKLMTVEEIAGAFGFAPQTLRNWVALRKIPFIRIGGKTRFRKRSIEAWLERKESKPCL